MSQLAISIPLEQLKRIDAVVAAANAKEAGSASRQSILTVALEAHLKALEAAAAKGEKKADK